MTYSQIVARTVQTPNQSPRTGDVRPQYIVHHHEAGTSFLAVIESWRTGQKQGSCHVTISNEGEAVGIVPEELRAWSLSSDSFDSISLVTEIENETSGGSWPVSEAAHERAAQLTADWCRRYGIPCDRAHVIGHREVYTRFGKGYATACPGGLDLDWIVDRARKLLGGATAGSNFTPIEEEEDMIYPWVFITEDAQSGGTWFKYDGRAKYPLAPGDPQLLVDLGLAAKVEVKVLGPRINSIPTA